MMIDRAVLLNAKADYERQEQQSLADANAAHGAIAAIDALLRLLNEEKTEKAVENDQH